MPFPPRPRRLKTWRAFEHAVDRLTTNRRWIFRGVLNDWKPLTSLERVKHAWRLRARDLPAVEFKLTRDYRRHPEGVRALGRFENDLIYIWALMQHHGAPTRLMDWTYSPYVAAYFAFYEFLQRRSYGGRAAPATVWAINTDWLTKALKQLPEYAAISGKKEDHVPFEKLLTRQKKRLQFVSTATPMVLNQRLSVQQGIFLCHADVRKSWADNLGALGWTPDPSKSRAYVLDFKAEEAFRFLDAMNITARSLFPGLDGYSKFYFSRANALREIKIADTWYPDILK